MISKQERGMSIKRFLFLLILLSAGIYAFYFFRQQAAQDEQPKFITAKVSRGHIAQTVLATGGLVASKDVKVGAQVSGEISALYVEVGDTVKAGDKIAEINASTQQNTRDSAAAALSSSKAALTSAQAELKQAQQNYQRQKEMVSKDAASKESLESAVATLKSREAAVKQAEANIRRSQLELDNAGVNLGYTTVTAPMDGIVVAVAVEKGQTVNAVQESPTIATLAQTGTMTVKAEIAEADINMVKPGMQAYFTLLGKNSEKFTGTLKSIDPAPMTISDNNSTSTQTAVYYYGKMDVPNPNGKLRIGMTTNIVINVAEVDNVLLIPMTALKDDSSDESDNSGTESKVDVLVNGKPETRTVTLGLEDGIHIEIKKGLKEGEDVVVSSGDGKGSLPEGPGGPGGF
ncbi:MAG: efflux RND transporter periplasmic adaptor subunit [Cardiobacteriaceae bacterium]|nr:efflux RND transporter periplasmic adaptor subunit [Cardiobacteriaceae bacterium]